MYNDPNLPPVFQQFQRPQNNGYSTLKIIFGLLLIITGLISMISADGLSGLLRFIAGLLLFPNTLVMIERALARKIERVTKYVLIIALVFVSSLISVKSLTIPDSKTEKDSLSKNNNTSELKKTVLDYQYDILKQDGDQNTFQNFSLLIETSDKSEETIKRIGLDLKSKLCKGRCNVILYDDKDAYTMDTKLEEAGVNLGEKLANGEISKEQYRQLNANYEKKYYTKIADHLIGQVLIDSDELDYYPMRDSRYKELGGIGERTTDDTGSSSSIQTQPRTNTNVDISKEEQDSKARDAVAILDVYVKHNMNDPDSFEEVSYDYSYHGTYFIIALKFRGKNAWGAKVIKYIKAKTDLEGNVIEIINE